MPIAGLPLCRFRLALVLSPLPSPARSERCVFEGPRRGRLIHTRPQRSETGRWPLTEEHIVRDIAHRALDARNIWRFCPEAQIRSRTLRAILRPLAHPAEPRLGLAGTTIIIIIDRIAIITINRIALRIDSGSLLRRRGKRPESPQRRRLIPLSLSLSLSLYYLSLSLSLSIFSLSLSLYIYIYIYTIWVCMHALPLYRHMYVHIHICAVPLKGMYSPFEGTVYSL